MSCPMVLPKGKDRSWTREFYYTLRRMTRYMWWKENMDAKVEKAFIDVSVYGKGFVVIGREKR